MAADAQDGALRSRLQRAGLQPTRQRLALARVLLRAPVHLRADDILAAAREHLPGLSRATVYNALAQWVDRGLLRALPLGEARMVYDSSVQPHAHWYDEDSGQLHDLPAEVMASLQLPPLAPGQELAGVDLVVRVRRSRRQPIAR